MEVWEVGGHRQSCSDRLTDNAMLKYDTKVKITMIKLN